MRYKPRHKTESAFRLIVSVDALWRSDKTRFFPQAKTLSRVPFPSCVYLQQQPLIKSILLQFLLSLKAARKTNQEKITGCFRSSNKQAQTISTKMVQQHISFASLILQAWPSIGVDPMAQPRHPLCGFVEVVKPQVMSHMQLFDKYCNEQPGA